MCETFMIKQDHTVYFEEIISMRKTFIFKQDHMVNLKKIISMCDCVRHL